MPSGHLTRAVKVPNAQTLGGIGILWYISLVYATYSLGVGYLDSPGKMPAGHWIKIGRLLPEPDPFGGHNDCHNLL